MASQPWVSIDAVKDYLGTDAPDNPEDELRLENAITAASELLYSLSGRKYPGIYQSIVRPTARLEQHPYPERFSAFWPWPMNSWGICCGPPHNRCDSPVFIGLGRTPLVSIEEIEINGEIFDLSGYRIENNKWLVRTDCACGWPTCGNCGDFWIHFTYGENPPQLGIDASMMLAAEIYRATTPSLSASCKLPARLTSISRQGVTMALIDPMDFMDKGLTGIYQIDLFINAYNPGHQIRKPLVWSPDMVNVGQKPTWPTMP